MGDFCHLYINQRGRIYFLSGSWGSCSWLIHHLHWSLHIFFPDILLLFPFPGVHHIRRVQCAAEVSILFSHISKLRIHCSTHLPIIDSTWCLLIIAGVTSAPWAPQTQTATLMESFWVSIVVSLMISLPCLALSHDSLCFRPWPPPRQFPWQQ